MPVANLPSRAIFVGGLVSLAAIVPMRHAIGGFLVLSFVLFGCGHTNRLAEYPVVGSTVLFESKVLPTAIDAEVWIQPPPRDTATPRQVSWMIDIVRIAGEVVTETAAYRKLSEAIVPEELAIAAGRGFQEAVVRWLRVTPVRSLEQEPTFLAETILEKYRLTSTPSGVYAEVELRSRILHRGTARVVWEVQRSASIPIQQTRGLAYLPGVATATSAVHAARLLSLESEELRQLFARTAQAAGEQVGETLREDVEKLPQKAAR